MEPSANGVKAKGLITQPSITSFTQKGVLYQIFSRKETIIDYSKNNETCCDFKSGPVWITMIGLVLTQSTNWNQPVKV